MIQMRYRKFAAGLILLLGATSLRSLHAVDSDKLEMFDYGGSMFVQGFYLARDLPLSRPEDLGRSSSDSSDSVCPPPDPKPDFLDNSTTTRCREEDDFYRARFRLDLSFRPNSYVDVLYGLEVGDVVFGRETDTYGPGSGGGGSGRTNLETRQLILKVHNLDDSLSSSIGIFSFSSPSGIVVANSGAGVKLDWRIQPLSSRFEVVHVLKEDRSWFDDDSNGFSDENYWDVDLSTASWKYEGLSWIRTNLYGVHRSDSDPSVDGGDGEETSKMYWGGLYLNFRLGAFSLLLHGVMNRGYFERPKLYNHLSDYEKTLTQAWLTRSGYTIGSSKILTPRGTEISRNKTYVVASAGQAEIAWQATDYLQLIAAAAGGTGRPGKTNPDGSSTDYNRDQFRTAGSGFQMTDIAVDSSGGYTIFSGGQLTGLVVDGYMERVKIYESMELQVGWFDIDAYKPPDLGENRFYTLYPFRVSYSVANETQITSTRVYDVPYKDGPQIHESSRNIGQEWNLKLSWNVWEGFDVVGRAAYFDADSAYRALYDVQYGDDIVEVSLAATQTF